MNLRVTIGPLPTIAAGTIELLSTMRVWRIPKNGGKPTHLGATIEPPPTMTAWLVQNKARKPAHLGAAIELLHTISTAMLRSPTHVERLRPTIPSALL
jgi:hypothetical protein